MRPPETGSQQSDVPAVAAMSPALSAAAAGDPSKWSKSKKKRMRTKKTKMEKRRESGNAAHENVSAGEQLSASTNKRNNKGVGKGTDISCLRESCKSSSDGTVGKDGAAGDDKKKRQRKELPLEKSPRAAAAVDASDIDTPESGKQAVMELEPKKVKNKRSKHTKETGVRDEKHGAPPNALASTVKAEGGSPEEGDDSQKPKQEPPLDRNENEKPKLDRRASRPPSPLVNDDSATTPLRRPGYSFQVDDTDHCETPLQAYRDVADVLDRLAHSLGKTRASLIIYDPYYCDGGIKRKLATLGFANCINENRDFYTDIKKKTTPVYDVLVTNPPYSGVHMNKLLQHCAGIAMERTPFLLLLPHFVYTKDYYQRALTSTRMSSSMFFLVPSVRYSYAPPAWVTAEAGSKALAEGKTKTAPFPSFWYCRAPSTGEDAMTVSPAWLAERFGPSGSVRPTHHSKLRYAKCSKDIPRDFRGEFDPNNKRANPKARKRAAKMRREAASGAGRGACTD